jgi:hypothetical protein
MLVYHMPEVPAQAQYAKELYERIRREFPEVGLPLVLSGGRSLTSPVVAAYLQVL